MERRIISLGRALREAGAPVSTPEVLDGARAALAVGIARRGDLRAALRASLVKRSEDLAAFDEHFERLFPAGIPRPVRRRGGKAARGGIPGAGDGAGAGAGGGSGAAAARREGEASGVPHAGEGTGDDQRARSRESRGDEGGEAAAEAAAREAEAERDADGAAATARREASSRAGGRRLLAKGFRERWSAAEEREAAAAMEQLAGSLATRRALRRRRSRRGAVDMAGTLRANLVHGGVPFVLRRRRRVIGRRDLVLLADVSGSVRRAAAMFLTILGRLRGRFAGVRAFAYVDRPAEIPASLARATAAQIAAALAAALPLDALSDHGEALRRFNRDFPGAIGGSSVVVILGDARNNRFPAQAWELEAIRRRCRRLVWIVPEPPSLWGSGDSAIRAYAPLCDRVIAAPNPATLALAALELARDNILHTTRQMTR